MKLAYSVLETAHTAFCIQFVYDYLIHHFGDFKYLASINWYAISL